MARNLLPFHNDDDIPNEKDNESALRLKSSA
jgi:hypothetical protein